MAHMVLTLKAVEAETYPQTDAPNISLYEPWKNNFFVDYRPEMDAVTGVFSTCTPVSWNGMPLKEMDAFQQRLFNSQRWSLFFVETWFPPKPMPFMSKMLSTLNLFCLTQCPQNGCLYERCSQCEASSFKAKGHPNGCLHERCFQCEASSFKAKCSPNGCLYERCSQCEACSFKATCPPNGCLYHER